MQAGRTPLTPPLARVLATVLAVVVAGVLLLGPGAAPASAHAVVTSSSPGDKEKLTTAPTEVTITFSEGVTSDLGGLKVLDATGTQVDNGDSSQPTPEQLHVTLKPGLPDGSYVANYKVVSEDGHPISGAIVYGVGSGAISDVSGVAASNDPKFDTMSKVSQFVMYLGALLAAGMAFFLLFVHDGAPDREPLGRVARIATIVAAIGILGLVLAQAAQATGQGLGAAFDLNNLRGVLKGGLGWQSAVMLVGLAACHLAVDAKKPVVGQSLAFYGGLAVTSSFVLWGHSTESPQPWLSIPSDIVHVTVAAVWFGGLVGLTMTLRGRMRTADVHGRPRYAAAPVASADDAADAPDAPAEVRAAGSGSGTATALLERPAVTVAAGDGPPTAPPDATATAGGAPATDEPDAPADGPVPGSFGSTVQIVERFSNLAALSVALLIVAGVALGWTEVGSFDALLSTTYGQLLLLKSGGVSIVLFLALYNRFFLLPWLLPKDGGAAAVEPTAAVAVERDEASEGADEAAEDGPVELTAAEQAVAERAGWRTLISTVIAEAAIIVVVLGITAVLVNTTPGRTVQLPAGPYEQTQPFQDGKVSLIVTPNEVGTNNFHVDFIAADGSIADPAEKVTLEMKLPSKDVGPFTRDMIKGGKGHFLLEDVDDLSIAGDWEITLVVRVSDFDQTRVTFQDTVAP